MTFINGQLKANTVEQTCFVGEHGADTLWEPEGDGATGGEAGRVHCRGRKAGSTTGAETERTGRGQAGSITGESVREMLARLARMT